MFVNRHASAKPLVNLLLADVTNLYALSGVLLMAVIYHCWQAYGIEVRARLLTGALAAILAGLFGRFLQHTIPSRPRPMHDPMLDFQLPSIVDPNTLNAWSAFPSDHAAVWFGLATTILIANRKLGTIALIWAFVTVAIRNYLGFHHPTDILGGALLGFLVVWLSQAEVLQRSARRVVIWGGRHQPVFCAAAFFVSYQIATLFDDLRGVAGSIAKLLTISRI